MKNATLIQAPNGKYQAIYGGEIVAQSLNKDYVVNNITEGKCNKAIQMGVTGVIVDPTDEIVAEQALLNNSGSQNHGSVLPQVAPENNFSINERFEFLENLTSMLIRDKITSLLVTGEGGLGKSHTVKQGLLDANLIDTRSCLVDDELAASDPDYEAPGDYIIIKGYSSAKGLFRSLYENRNKIVVFDDCDDVLKHPVAINLLKAALESEDERIITWNSDTKSNGEDASLPRFFRFTGRVIFISNLPQFKLDQAIKSRSLRVDLSMTSSDKIERMKTILPHILPNFPMNVKKDALEFIEENQEIATDLNMRTLISVCKIREDVKKNWKGLATYTISA